MRAGTAYSLLMKQDIISMIIKQYYYIIKDTLNLTNIYFSHITTSIENNILLKIRIVGIEDNDNPIPIISVSHDLTYQYNILLYKDKDTKKIIDYKSSLLYSYDDIYTSIHYKINNNIYKYFIYLYMLDKYRDIIDDDIYIDRSNVSLFLDLDKKKEKLDNTIAKDIMIKCKDHNFVLGEVR